MTRQTLMPMSPSSPSLVHQRPMRSSTAPGLGMNIGSARPRAVHSHQTTKGRLSPAPVSSQALRREFAANAPETAFAHHRFGPRDGCCGVSLLSSGAVEGMLICAVMREPPL